MAWEGLRRIVRQRPHPAAKLGRMHPQVLRGLRITNPALLDQPNSLKLELTGELPPLHDAPPAPSKHLTRCLRNRVQARQQDKWNSYLNRRKARRLAGEQHNCEIREQRERAHVKIAETFARKQIAECIR